MKQTMAILTLLALLASLATLVWASERPAGRPAIEARQPKLVDDSDLCVGENLLANPSFEGQYASYNPDPGIPDCNYTVCVTAQMAPGWLPWWRSNSGLPDDYDRNPEYKPSLLVDQGANGPGDRVRSGEHAQQYFSFFGTHVAGVYQQVPVTPGRTYRFCVWGHSWSAGEWIDYDANPPTIPDTDFASGAQFGIMMQRVGIDPTGGIEWPVDGSGTNIVWGPAREQYDIWGQFSVEVTAQSSTITVYTFSDPMWAVRNNDVYWDDAALIELLDTTMTVDPAVGLTFLADVDQPALLTQRLSVQFDPDQGYSWSATADSVGGLVPSLSPTGGGSTDQLTVEVNTAGLTSGTYTADVIVTASGGAVSGSPAQIPVTLHVVPELSHSYLPVWVFGP